MNSKIAQVFFRWPEYWVATNLGMDKFLAVSRRIRGMNIPSVHSPSVFWCSLRYRATQRAKSTRDRWRYTMTNITWGSQIGRDIAMSDVMGMYPPNVLLPWLYPWKSYLNCTLLRGKPRQAARSTSEMLGGCWTLDIARHVCTPIMANNHLQGQAPKKAELTQITWLTFGLIRGI